MKINVTVPTDYTYRKLIKMTKMYMKGNYNEKVAKTVFEGKNKGYFACIKRGGIEIEVVVKSRENVFEIQIYLEFLFCHKYIGISIENNQDMRLDLKNVRCFKV